MSSITNIVDAVSSGLELERGTSSAAFAGSLLSTAVATGQ